MGQSTAAWLSAIGAASSATLSNMMNNSSVFVSNTGALLQRGLAMEEALVSLEVASFELTQALAKVIEGAGSNPDLVANLLNATSSSGGGLPPEEAGKASVKAKDLKRLPDNKVKDLGGESYTQSIKAKTGKSKADLYWDPKTGDVYSIPKSGGTPEYVDTIPTGR